MNDKKNRPAGNGAAEIKRAARSTPGYPVNDPYWQGYADGFRIGVLDAVDRAEADLRCYGTLLDTHIMRSVISQGGYAAWNELFEETRP